MAAFAAVACTALLVPGASATPRSPTVGTVQAQLTKLALKNTMLIEQFDQAQVDVQAKQAAARAAQNVAMAAQGAYDKAALLLGATATAEYENGSFSTTGALLSSDSGQSYLAHLQALQAVSTHTSQLIRAVAAAKSQADSASTVAQQLLKIATKKRDALVAQRAAVQKQVDSYTSILASMTVVQRTAFNAFIAPAVSNAAATALIAALKSSPATSRAAIAVKFALEQVGKPYVFATAGPNTYDCSGLTMASWAAAGVSLPHSSEEQYNMGRAVPLSQIQPGDLLFYYGPPPGHVTIYVGDGVMVSAPEPGENVKIVNVSDYASSYVGARRVG